MLSSPCQRGKRLPHLQGLLQLPQGEMLQELIMPLLIWRKMDQNGNKSYLLVENLSLHLEGLL